MIKKIIAILLSLSILFMLTACGNDKEYKKDEESQTENKTEEVSSTEEPSSTEENSTEPTPEETSTEELSTEKPTQPKPEPTQPAESKPTKPIETESVFNPTVVYPSDSMRIRKILTDELEISISQTVKSYYISGNTVVFKCQFGGATVYSYHSYTDEYGNVYTEKKQDSIAFDLAPYGTKYGLTASLNYNLYSSDDSLLKTGTANSSTLKCKYDPYNLDKSMYEIRVNITNPEEVAKIEVLQ